MENFIALANRIVDLREQRGFSQTELAKRLGVSKSTMSKIELGNRRLSTDEDMEIIKAILARHQKKEGQH